MSQFRFTLLIALVIALLAVVSACATPTPTPTPAPPTPTPTLVPTATPTPTPGSPTPTPTATATPIASLTEGIAKALPSMVRLLSGTKQWTGVMIDPSGTILTTSTDLGASPLADFRMPDGSSGRAWVHGRDDKFGLALLRVVSPGQQFPSIEVYGGEVPTRNDEIALLAYAGNRVEPEATNSFVIGSRQDIATGLDYVQYQAITLGGEHGGAVIDVHGRLRGIRMGTDHMVSIGVGRSGETWALDATSLQNAMIPRLDSGLTNISAVDGACENIGAPPPIPAIYSGTITVSGAPAPVGTQIYATAIKTSTGEQLWFSETVKDEGRYFLTISICDGTFNNSPVEFWVDGKQSLQNSSYVSGSTPKPELVFP